MLVSLLQRSKVIRRFNTARLFSTDGPVIWQKEIRKLDDDCFFDSLKDLPAKRRVEITTLGRKVLDKECAKQNCFEYARVGDAVSNRFLYHNAEHVLPQIPDIELENAGEITRAAVGLIHPIHPEATQDLARFLLEEANSNLVENPVKLLESRGGMVTCKKDGDSSWVATAVMGTVDGTKEEHALSRLDWAAKEYAASAILDADPLSDFYYEYPTACQYFKTFDRQYEPGDSCPTCGHECPDLESLLDHMEHNPHGLDVCGNAKNGLDWDACGISHETGDFMWGDDD